MDKFNKIYSNFLNNIILEGNVNGLTTLFQENYFATNRIKSYNDLNEEQKQYLQQYINTRIKQTEQKVNNITSNADYKSWIYDILKNKDKDIYEDNIVIKDIINDFDKIIKRSDLKIDKPMHTQVLYCRNNPLINRDSDLKGDGLIVAN